MEATEEMTDEDWRAPEDDDNQSSEQIDEYDLTSTPNDFNITTIDNFITSGAVRIPAFQRNYVWDIKGASRLIESLILGLPVPQIFLYEEARNSFLVVDGQQRLMTIYYFMRMRFPRRERRAELRRVFDTHGRIPEEFLHDDSFFDDFKLRLPEIEEGQPNKFTGLKYETLGDYKAQFDLRTIRNVIVKQVAPKDDDSSIYEMFNRLNTGGISLLPQEIRASLCHSDFFDLLAARNLDPRWRALVGTTEPDLHMRDVEVLLRATAMWKTGESYRPSMYKFLNRFAKEAQRYDEQELARLGDAYNWFLGAVTTFPSDSFRAARAKFVVAVFEAAFSALMRHYDEVGAFEPPASFVDQLRNDNKFKEFTETRPTQRQNVQGRLDRADAVLALLIG